MTTCDASTPCNKHRTPRDKRKAFTLLEVLVALAVLAAGATSLSLYLGAFRRISSAELSRADRAIAAVRYMESQILDPPACADTVYTRRTSLTGNKQIPTIDKRRTSQTNNKHAQPSDTLPTITHLPISPSLQYLELRTPYHTFWRLVRCKKASR